MCTPVGRPSWEETLYNYSHIRYRSMFLQPLLVVVTLGLYVIFWFHAILGELHRANNRGPEVGHWKWTILACIPLVFLYSFWHFAGEYSHFVRERYPRWLVFVLWIVFPPAVWFLVQIDLNRAARFHW